MGAIRLLLDEDTQLLLAGVLRDGGHDVRHVNEVGLRSAPDPDVLAFATSEGRAVFTHNARDFVPLARAYTRDGKSHAGILVSAQAQLGELRRRLLRFLADRSAESMVDVALWLP